MADMGQKINIGRSVNAALNRLAFSQNHQTEDSAKHPLRLCRPDLREASNFPGGTTSSTLRAGLKA